MHENRSDGALIWRLPAARNFFRARMSDSFNSDSEESDRDEGNGEQPQKRKLARRTASALRRKEADNEREAFLNEGMLSGLHDEEDEEAAEALRDLSIRANRAQNAKRSSAELDANEMFDYSKAFFKRKDVKDIVQRKDEYGNRIIKYLSYSKEFFVWNFWKVGADPNDNDDDCTDSLISYLKALVSNGKDADGKKFSCAVAKQIPLLATAEHLEEFLREVFIKFRQRYFFCVCVS